MCCSLVSVKKKRINLVDFQNVEEEFHPQNQMTTSHNLQQHFAPSHTLSQTYGPEVTVIYTGQNLKSNTFWHELKNISHSIGLDNG